LIDQGLESVIQTVSVKQRRDKQERLRGTGSYSGAPPGPSFSILCASRPRNGYSAHSP
jgi:hypothetical protein